MPKGTLCVVRRTVKLPLRTNIYERSIQPLIEGASTLDSGLVSLNIVPDSIWSRAKQGFGCLGLRNFSFQGNLSAILCVSGYRLLWR